MNPMTRLVAFILVILVSIIVGVFVLQIAENKNSEAAKIRVACVGDSITEGSEYPNELWMLLGSDYTVGNFGVGGTTVSLDSASPYMYQSAFQDAKQFQPKIVIIMLGTNDAHPDHEQYIASFVNDYIKLVKEFQGLESKPQIWIVKPPPVFNNGTGISTNFFAMSIIPLIEQVTNELNLPLIDVYTHLTGHSEYFVDGVHPNLEGSEVIATVIFNALISQNTQDLTP
jgi:acyl-CoA thioesterase I